MSYLGLRKGSCYWGSSGGGVRGSHGWGFGVSRGEEGKQCFSCRWGGLAEPCGPWCPLTVPPVVVLIWGVLMAPVKRFPSLFCFSRAVIAGMYLLQEFLSEFHVLMGMAPAPCRQDSTASDSHTTVRFASHFTQGQNCCFGCSACFFAKSMLTNESRESLPSLDMQDANRQQLMEGRVKLFVCP